MGKKYEAWIPPARPMEAIGEKKWFAKAKVKQTGTGRSDDFITLRGEWYGRTKEEAEEKAREEARDWIRARENED